PWPPRQQPQLLNEILVQLRLSQAERHLIAGDSIGGRYRENCLVLDTIKTRDFLSKETTHRVTTKYDICLRRAGGRFGRIIHEMQIKHLLARRAYLANSPQKGLILLVL